MNHRQLCEENQELQKEDDEDRGDIIDLKSRLLELIDAIKKGKELGSPENKDVHTKYNHQAYECTVLKELKNDIEVYIKGLEHSLLQYHQERMEQINKIIRQLWRAIYRGNDCDYIEIKTEGSVVRGVKCSYNYKVVQRKQDVELEMRGRCSAGQKVLASLVIRIALGETFSKNCGILALDEPLVTKYFMVNP